MKISIVLPCFNVAKYLRGVLECLRQQTQDDWEAIFINDGSTDNTQNILEQAIKTDDRLHLISQVNQGVSVARNTGIDEAKGEYVYFLDADDLIENNFIEKIREHIRKSPDLVLFGFKEQLKSGRFVEHKALAMPIESLLKQYLTNRKKIHLCSCVFRRCFLNEKKIRFNDKTCYGEDREFIVNVLNKHPLIEIVPYSLYTYMYRESSVMRNGEYNLKRFSSVEACERIYKLLETTKFKTEALIHLKTTIFLHLRLLRRSNNPSPSASSKLALMEQKYASILTPFVYYRDGLFCYVATMLWNHPLMFDKFLKLI